MSRAARGGFAPLLLLAGLLATAAADPPAPGVGPVQKVRAGFRAARGPVADADGNVYVADDPAGRILKVDAAGTLTTVLENGDGGTGLALDARGRVVASRGGKKLIALDPATKKVSVLADGFDGPPTALAVDRTGGVYAAAPDAGAVYYLPPHGTLARIHAGKSRPTGLTLSPDEATLYVVAADAADVLAYPVARPGILGRPKVFCQLVQNPDDPAVTGGGGAAVDARGNLYVARPALKAVQVVGPDGQSLGLLRVPEEPSGCAFGGADLKTLYVAAQTSLYAVKLEEAGHRSGAVRSEEPLPEAWDYAGPMRTVAARFRGTEGVVLHVGGSMTIANPYGSWPRGGKGKTPDDAAVLEWMHTEAKDKTDGWWLCRTELEMYRAYTAESGLKAAMLHAGGARGLPTLEKMLDDYRPRLVTIECGLYDADAGTPVADYRKSMGRALDLILDRGAIPVLNTIPPFRAQPARTRELNDVLRALAKDRGVPVLDLEREVFVRRPDDWFGTLMDRMHLTGTQAGGSPSAEPTPDNLRKSGYHLRGWLTVRKVAEIKRRVLDAGGK